ncbi:MAG: M6 family metalloprotease domain-containing protein [Elusimicrobiaceae bacterium]
MQTSFRRIFYAALAALVIAEGNSFALSRPRPGDLDRARADGTFAEKLAFAKKLGNNKFSNNLIQKYNYRMQQMRMSAQGKTEILSAPPPDKQNMPTTGSINIFVLPIKFNDASNKFTKAQIQTAFFGGGTGSLKSFYLRSSFNALSIGGTTLDWYTYPGTRAQAEAAGNEEVIKAALNYHVGRGVDFSSYDNKGNGVINYFIVVWAGTQQGWASFWWSYKTSWTDTTYSVNGKDLNVYSWQWEAYDPSSATAPDATTAQHETGHALGLPDYYDYDDNIGPDGGIGDYDMMDGSTADHNAFSKFLLGWLTPQVYTSGTSSVSLSPVATSGQALQMMPTAVSGTSWDEYYLAEYRVKSSDDANLPASGIYLWHVDARLTADNTDFYYDNSFARHKLLKLVEADGLDHIEKDSNNMTAASVYTAGSTFSPASTPASTDYTGKNTGITMGPLTAGSGVYTVPVSIAQGPAKITNLSGTRTAVNIAQLSWTVPANAASYQIHYATWTAAQSFNFNNGFGGVWDMDAFNAATGNWRIVQGAGPDGSNAIVSGNLSRTQENTSNNDYYGYSEISKVVYGPATVAFTWKVSSEEDYDYLNFLIDDKPAAAITGITGWSTVSKTIPEGEHKIAWEYRKDLSYQDGEDKGYVDNITITPSGTTPLDWAYSSVITAPTPAAAGTTQNLTVGLSLDTTYYFAIRSLDSRGVPSYISSPATVYTLGDNTAPSAVSNLSATPGSLENQITLNWTAPGDDAASGNITGGKYEIRYATNSNISLTEGTLISISTNSTAGSAQKHTVSGLTGSDMTYYFGLWTYDENGNRSAISNIANSVVLRDTAPPSAVTNLSAVPGSAEGSIKLSWTAPGDNGAGGALSGASFIVHYSSSGAVNINTGTELIISTSAAAGSTQSLTISGLIYGQTYYFSLWTEDAKNNLSAQSNAANAQATDLVPAAPANLRQSGSSTNLTLQWDPVSAGDLAYYRVYQDTTPAGKWDDGIVLATTTLTVYTITSLPQGVTIYFRVTAIDNPPLSLESVYSNEVTYLDQDLLGPVQTAFASASHGTLGEWKSKANAVFSWSYADQGFSGVKGYYYKISSSAAQNVSGVTTGGIYTTGVSASTTVADGVWYFNMAAQDNASNYSSVFSQIFRVDTASPTAAITLSSTDTLRSGTYQVALAVSDISGTAGSPLLSYSLAGGASRSIVLSQSGSNWTGSLVIESSDTAGTGTFSFSAADNAGNTGTAITSGASFTFDTAVTASGGTVTNPDNTSVYMPANSVTSAITVRINNPPSSRNDISGANASLDPISGYSAVTEVNFNREFSATDASSVPVTSFNAPVLISIPYSDADNNGKVDGTAIDADSLAMYYLNGTRWDPVPGSTNNASAKAVQAWVSHFSVYSLLSVTKLSVDLTGVKVYPQPCYMKRDSNVIFGRLPNISDIRIFIYTIAGELVRTLNKDTEITLVGANLKGVWDGRNSNGEQVASGMYIYLIKAEGTTSKGRIGIFW